MRQLGWISLIALLVMAACGAPTVTNIGDSEGGSTVGDDDDDGGDDDDDAATTLPTATTPPGAAPILTNVPSFATWNSSIRPLMCAQCHMGSSGSLLFFNSTSQSDLKYFWFQSICNRDSGADNEGTQAFNPPTGRFPQYMSGNEPAGHTAIGNNAATVNAWMTAPGVTATPPSCLDYYDLANSS